MVIVQIVLEPVPHHIPVGEEGKEVSSSFYVDHSFRRSGAAST